MLDLTAPLVEVWFAGAKLGEYTNDIEALKAASLHADSLPLTTEKVEYEIRRDTMKYIVHRRIVGPDAPALGPVLTISSTALTVTLDRPATGPTQISRYELERLVGSTWTQIASGLNIFGAGMAYPDSGLSASTAYQYRARAVDTTERASEYSYSSGTTSAGVSNTAPVWQSGTIALSVQAGSSVALSPYCSDPEGDQITYTLLDTNPNDTTISVTQSGVLQTTTATAVGANSVIVRASDGALTANKTIALTVTAASTGTNYSIAPGVATFDASQVQPGDTITILRGTGTRGPLTIANVTGTLANPITIRGDQSGQVIIRRASPSASTYWAFVLRKCRHFVLDGELASVGTAGTFGYKCGIKVMYAAGATSNNQDSINSLIKFDNLISGQTTPGVEYATIRYVEFDGGWIYNGTSGTGSGPGSNGFAIHTNDDADDTIAKIGSVWQNNLKIEYTSVQRMQGAGYYIGHNWVNGCVPLRNIEVSNNWLKNCGGFGILCKSWLEGTNSVHDNIVDTCGLNYQFTTASAGGIMFQSCTGSIYNNFVKDSGGSALTRDNNIVPHNIRIYPYQGPSRTLDPYGYGTYSTLPVTLYNNLSVGAGSTTAGGRGISIDRDDADRPYPEPYVYNNTLASNAQQGVYANNTSGGWVRNNVVIGNGSAISSTATATNNLTTGTPSGVFVAPESDNYRLKAEEAAVGSIGTDIAATDIEGASRAGTASKGAYEYA